MLIRHIPYYVKQTEFRRQEMDLNAWLNGAYVARAIAILGKKKYPDSPLNVFGIPDNEQEDSPRNNPAEGFRAYAIAFNQSRRRMLEAKGGEENAESS